MSKKPQSLIGIELHENEIRIVQVVSKANQTSINKMGRIAMPAGCIAYGLVIEPERISEAIKGLLASMNITSTYAAVGVPDECVPVRTLAVPPAPDGELNVIVAGEVDDNHLIRNPNGSYGFVKMSHQSQPEDTHGWDEGAEVWIDSHVSKTRPEMVTVFATEQEVIKGYQAAVEGAGLTITRMEPTHYASYRALMAAEGPSSTFFAIITGPVNTDIAVVSDGQLVAFRRIEIGSRLLTGDNVTSDQYAYLKSVSATSGDTDTPTRDPRLDRSAVESFSTEVHRTIYYYQREYPSLSECERIITAVDDSRLDRLWEEVGQRLGMNVEAARPFGNCIDRTTVNASFASRFESVGSTAFGLAIEGSVLERAPVIDLFRFERIAAKDDDSKRYLRVSIVASVLAVLLGIGACTVYRSNIYLMDRDIQVAKNASSIAKSAIDLKVKERHSQADQYRSLRKNAIPATEVLDAIAGSISTGTGLDSVTVALDQTVIIDGQSIDESSMLGTIKSLQDCPLIHDLRINWFHQSSPEKGSNISFEFRGKTVTADRLKNPEVQGS